MIDVEVVRYSEAFKRHVVSELEAGRLASHGEARAKYGIRGAATLTSWLRKYGKNHLLRRVVRVETPNERNHLEALKARIRELEHAIADSRVKETLAEAYFQVVCEEFGVADVGALKKKYRQETVARAVVLGAGRKGITVTSLCKALSLSRQAYYKGRRARQRRRIDEEAVVKAGQRRAHNAASAGRAQAIGADTRRFGEHGHKDRS